MWTYFPGVDVSVKVPLLPRVLEVIPFERAVAD